ncbi:hypothetical protein [Ferruginibacter sp.]|nr:hypothetical protein [Ferruginibacter sp.]
MEISLREFILKGNFGPVQIGMTKNEIINTLGKPDSDTDYGESGELYYGYYEFFYWTENQILFAIQNDHLIADCTNHNEMILFENNNFKIDVWFLEVGRDFTYKEIKDILNKEGLEYTEEISYKNGPNILKFKSGVFFDFSSGYIGWGSDEESSETWHQLEKTIENLDDYILNGIGYCPSDTTGK